MVTGPTRRHIAERPTGTPLALGLGILWVALATIRPDTTYHLAPLIVAALPSVAGTGSSMRGLALERGLLGLAIAGWASLALVWLGALDGPALPPFTSALQETIVFSVVGAVGGSLWLRVRARIMSALR